MKKILLSIGVVVIFAAYVFYQHAESQNATDVSPVTQIQSTAPQPTTADTNPATSTPPPQAPAATSTPSTPVATSGKFKDGSYTGAVADAFYGKIQVQAVIAGGKITDVQFLQYPNSPGHTTQVSNEALPQLKSEAIAAQSAQVDVVSGATQDSQAFQQSLQSALNQAM